MGGGVQVYYRSSGFCKRVFCANGSREVGVSYGHDC